MRKYIAMTGAVAFLGLPWASLAAGDSCNAAHKEKTFSGNISYVDPTDKTVSVKGVFITRSFSLGNDCRVSLQDKPVASLAELRPGQKVDIRYENAEGVLIARNVAQRDLVITGHITSIDPASKTLMLKHGMFTRNFAIAPDCAVVMNDNRTAGLNNLQVGDFVHVIYEPAKGSHVATRIEQTSAVLIGTVSAIDSTTRSVKLKEAYGEKKFNLADHCAIVINGRPNGTLSDLRIGDRVSLSYENVNGVLVVNRLTPLTGALAAEPAAPAPAQTAQSGSQESRPLGYGYGSH